MATVIFVTICVFHGNLKISVSVYCKNFKITHLQYHMGTYIHTNFYFDVITQSGDMTLNSIFNQKFYSKMSRKYENFKYSF